MFKKVVYQRELHKTKRAFLRNLVDKSVFFSIQILLDMYKLNLNYQKERNDLALYLLTGPSGN